MSGHIAETELALYASADLDWLHRAAVRLHVSRCERCRGTAENYRADRERVREIAAEMPAGLDWERLAAEMTANIRVGLEAGECVAPRKRARVQLRWHPALAASAVAVATIAVLCLGWWLNMPPSTTQALERAMSAIAHGRGGAAAPSEAGTIVEANSSGIELRENGSTLGIGQGSTRPVAVSLSVQGSASARYVDADTGQMTITSVYAQ
ncbi:MAG: hypothetical protein ACRD30_11215 [Bryobacteraceae bacterium]